MQSYTKSNLKYFNSSGVTLLTGDVDVSTAPRDGIHIPTTVSNKSNVIVNKRQFASLKVALSSLPVTNYPIHLYDQLGNVVSRMEVNRKSNLGGMLDVNTQPQTLLSHMVIPSVDDGATNYLLLQEYTPLNHVFSEDKKLQLLKQDIDLLNAKTPHLKSVVLVIAKTLHEMFLKLYPTYTEFFNVVPVKDENVVNYVAEHICGKVIAGSKPTFQGFLNFGVGTNILRCVSDNSSVVYTTRSNGRVQINVDKETTSGKFLAIIESSSLKFPYTITEEVTGASFTFTPDMSVKPDSVPDVKLDYIISMMENYKFSTSLNPSMDNDKIMKFVLNPANHANVLKYLFTKSLRIDKEFAKLNDDAKLIVRTYDEGFAQIKQALSSKVYENNDHHDSYSVSGPLGGGVGYSGGGALGPAPPHALGLGRQASGAPPHNYYAVASSGADCYATPALPM